MANSKMQSTMPRLHGKGVTESNTTRLVEVSILKNLKQNVVYE